MQNPNVSVDCAVFGFDNDCLNLLLIEQKLTNKQKVQYALPGDLILDDESLDQAAERVLFEISGLSGIFLQQFKAFGDPDRVRDIKDLEFLQSYRETPQARVITIGYLALVKMEDFVPEASSFAAKAFWQKVEDLPPLAFDHTHIVHTALKKLRHDFIRDKTGFELLPERFTLGQVQRLYEIILGRKLDKRNFRKKILKEELVTATTEKQEGVLHKPARLYELNLYREE